MPDTKPAASAAAHLNPITRRSRTSPRGSHDLYSDELDRSAAATVRADVCTEIFFKHLHAGRVPRRSSSRSACTGTTKARLVTETVQSAHRPTGFRPPRGVRLDGGVDALQRRACGQHARRHHATSKKRTKRGVARPRSARRRFTIGADDRPRRGRSAALCRATLSLTLRAPATFGAFTPGGRGLHGDHHCERDEHRG